MDRAIQMDFIYLNIPQTYLPLNVKWAGPHPKILHRKSLSANVFRSYYIFVYFSKIRSHQISFLTSELQMFALFVIKSMTRNKITVLAQRR